MNLLTIRHPTHLGWSDSCPFGLGGFTLRGRAWRIRVPKEATFRGDDTVNNLLEFLGMVITILLLIEEANEERQSCLLGLGDNTSAIGWLFKSGRIDPKSKYHAPIKFIARHLTRSIIESNNQLAGQHLEGEKNDVADLLSFEGIERGKTNPLTVDRPPNDILTQRIVHNYPQLVPSHFKISPLPPSIASFACAAMQIIESSWIRNRKKPTGKLNELGTGGVSSSETSGTITPASLEFESRNELFSSSASLSATERASSTGMGELLASVRSRWWSRLSKVPQATWLRRFGNVTGPAPCTSREKTSEVMGG